MGGKEYDIELLFKALADRTRLRVINLIGDEEVCVCFFVEILRTNQPKISRHLAYLRRAGIVGARRQGPWMHYRIVEPPDRDAARVLTNTLAWLLMIVRCSATESDCSRFVAHPNFLSA